MKNTPCFPSGRPTCKTRKTRKTRLSLLLLGLLGLSLPVQAADQPTPQATPPGQTSAEPFFPLGSYYPFERASIPRQKNIPDEKEYQEKLDAAWKRVEADLAGMQKANMNFIWVVNIGEEDGVRLCKLAEKYGIKVAMTCGPLISRRNTRGIDQNDEGARKIVAAWKDLPALYAYVLVDEPRTTSMSHVENIRAALERADPSRPSLVVSMPTDTQAALDMTKLPIICPDVYPFFGPRDPNGPNTPGAQRAYYRYVVNKTVTESNARGKTPWVMPGCFTETWGPWHNDEKGNAVDEAGSYRHWVMPTPAGMRWQIWHALAAGMRGVVFFVHLPGKNERKPGDPVPQKHLDRMAKDKSLPWIKEAVATNSGTALVYPDGRPTPQMIAMSEEYGAIKPFTGLLNRIRPADFPLVFSENGSIVGRTFRDPGDGTWYAILVNQAFDNKKPQETNLHVEDWVTGITNLRTRSDLPLEGNQAALTLEPGQGTILSFKAKPGYEPVLLYREMFTVRTINRYLKNARLEIAQAPWGFGEERSVLADPGDTSSSRRVVATEPGTVTYPLGSIGGRLYKGFVQKAVYRGGGPGKGQENVCLSYSEDGENFKRLSVDEYNRLIDLPAGATHIRFEIASRAYLTGFELIGFSGPVEQAAAK